MAKGFGKDRHFAYETDKKSYESTRWLDHVGGATTAIAANLAASIDGKSNRSVGAVVVASLTAATGLTLGGIYAAIKPGISDENRELIARTIDQDGFDFRAVGSYVDNDQAASGNVEKRATVDLIAGTCLMKGVEVTIEYSQNTADAISYTFPNDKFNGGPKSFANYDEVRAHPPAGMAFDGCIK